MQTSAGKIALLVCGEIHSPWNRESLGGSGIAVVFACGHRGLGQGLVATIRSIHTCAAAPVLHVQHVASKKSGNFHIVDASGKHVSKAGTLMQDTSGGWWRYAVWDV